MPETPVQTTFETDVRSGRRFRFGRNWAGFLKRLDDERIAEARKSLLGMLALPELTGTTFLDVGSGSGLFSLAARTLGARVRSFDFDPDSVDCTRTLRERYFPGDAAWVIESGSALDATYLASLGTFDITYSWGVLHHTGAMWRALDLVAATVKPGGRLFVMLYLDEGFKSVVWRGVKRMYCHGLPGKCLVLSVFVPYYVLRGLLEDLVRFRNPYARYRDYKRQRGMSRYHDLIDWLGGYPYEVAKPDDVIAFCRERGFTLQQHRLAEYVFRRTG